MASAEGATPRTVLGVVSQPASPEAFPGLYTTSLPERPFVDGGAAVLLNSQWGNRGVIVRVELGSGGVLLLSDAEEAPGSWALLDTDGGARSFLVSLHEDQGFRAWDPAAVRTFVRISRLSSLWREGAGTLCRFGALPGSVAICACQAG